MSKKWTNNQSDSGILRKSEFKEKKEELFVFGYSCKLFRDDERALHIDQGKHLIPWMGDETLKIDRYDARGALHDLKPLEAPPGGYDWRVELTRAEKDVEQLCDEERYRALHTDEDEEEMYKEEELKRLHAAGYGQVGFNYDTPLQPPVPASQVTENTEPFLPTASYKALFSADIVMPETIKQNAIIEKTSKFIASQGAQMEILIKAKQTDNPQFKFLERESELHPYYIALINLVKIGKWPEKAAEPVEEKVPENDEYLHPSLASTVIESAPSIPSIHYRPSADCDYTMLISKMRGEATLDEVESPVLAPGEVAPPGTEPLPPRASAEIARPPVMYAADHAPVSVPIPPDMQASQIAQYQQHYAAYYHQYMSQQAAIQATSEAKPPPAVESSALSLMKNYNSDSEGSDTEDSEDNQPIAPPEDIKSVIVKMAAYVARNGDEFAEIVRAKNDPRFTFLEPNNVYHPYYLKLMYQKRGVNGKESEKKNSVPVSFSIKKLKEPDPILPKPALPYESSSDEDSDGKTDETKTEKEDNHKTLEVKATALTIPNVVVYKMDNIQSNDLPSVKSAETSKPVQNSFKTDRIDDIKDDQNVKEVSKSDEINDKVDDGGKIDKNKCDNSQVKLSDETKAEKTKQVDGKDKIKYDEVVHRKEKKKHKDRKRQTESRDERKRRDREEGRRKKRKKHSKEDLDNDVISLLDNSDDLIDLTGDQSDSKVEADSETDKEKQQQRRRRAAEFLKKVGVDPAAAALPTTSLASAMVDTLESIRKKKADEAEKRRKRDKKRYRDKYGYDEESERSHRKSKKRKRSSDDSDSDPEEKRRKHRKEKKSKSKRKRRHEIAEEKQDHPLPPNMDLTSTLKELRTLSPTTELLQDIEQTSVAVKQDSSAEESEGEREVKTKRKKEDREYSEGEWSSDSQQDSDSTKE